MPSRSMDTVGQEKKFRTLSSPRGLQRSEGGLMPGNADRIILVYDADSGLGAMMLDVVKKLVGREDCALCEITYSPIGKRAAWSACEARLGVAVQELHRDQLPADWGIAR